MSHRDPRGQAAVEFALGSLVFVTVLLFGIHFAEAGYLSAKVHEAGAAAMWDATAYRSYSFGTFYDSSVNSVPSVNFPNNAADRYRDWDGRTRINTGSSPQMVLTKAEPMQVTCRRNARASYGLAPSAPSFGETGGISCSAQGDFGFGLLRMPNKIAEGASGFFKAANNSRVGSPTTLCSMGRANGSACLGELTLMLGDDALIDGNQASECELSSGSGGGTTCSNPRMYEVTRQTWDTSMAPQGWASGYTGEPERWAKGAVGGSGIPNGEITGFYLSFRGEESSFTEPLEISEGGGRWQTSPMDATMPVGVPYRTAYSLRQNCAAGAVSGLTGKRYCYLGKFPCGD